MKITRGFSRKVNLGNYETADFWCELEAEEYHDTSSESLANLAKEDVEASIKEFLKERETEMFSKEELVLIENARNGLGVSIEDYQELTTKNPRLIGAINEAKKEHKRSADYKATQVPRQ